MQIGIVIHNLQLMDSPQTVKDILTLISRENCINACLCGTLGKVAAIDAGLESLIDIKQFLKPSACIESLFESNDLVCLLNHGRELQTGRTFGRIVVSHIQNPEKKPLIQIERPGCLDGELIPWNRAADPYAKKLSGLLNLKISPPPMPVNTIETSNQGRHVLRRISTFPGANIMVEGIVVGKATSSEVTLVSENGFLTSIEGGNIKEQGIEILHKHGERVPVDLSGAWVKTTASRKSPDVCKSLMECKTEGIAKTTSLKKSFLQEKTPEGGVKVILIDHCAEHSFEMMKGTGLAITVGDDTTELAGNIFSRFGIPILGITDGDCDELATAVSYAPCSLVLRLKPGKDDEFGKKLQQDIFSGEHAAFFEDIESLKLRIINLAENSLESISEY
ncbi:hypothetical protein EO98_16785 [Methanosarcina sp. 2.H.T.1A.6]|uniref:DUF2117 family protein n=1 Tax=unclassified Methanosarcina TaxID=2644672 RepID=UPI0006222D9D|nr:MULTISPECIES: DUF2117 family protein [unclassified Methanosarcina]KKG13422.1 hypothetical protein EO97_10150 [Methanosarcina sp. 2.H.T.1A.15]KKG15021.1 hypothetical protein EO94_03840 [Methanosarcina sp. 2.H.T.1A.3]KKG20720.1 hypothetical protein EO96_17830 [Methanosarcina sp. 2.H.T.1A.8]KKG22037.1 hypothetical protein EO98_16785 [Methanosarcina sp. 2.H.T.1A.6]